MAAKPILSIHQVQKNFPGKVVLDGVGLTINQGEFFALVGVNGAGKTTLIKCMLDFCSMDGGAIRLFDQPHDHPASRDRLVFLPERFLPPYYLLGRDFLLFMARMHGVEYRASQVEALCHSLDLDPEVLDKPVKDYSKGMAQKLGLLGCLLSDRELLILDEPMSGLDPKARMRFKQHVLGLRGAGRSIFFSTHLLADVEELCDRMAILHEGRIRYVGTPQACCQTYDAFNLEQAFLNCIEQPAIAD